MFDKYKKKPVVIDAVQWDGTLEMARALVSTIGKNASYAENTGELLIHTLEGDHRADPQDWIIRGVKGEYYPCKPDIFSLTYQKEVEKPKLVK